MEVGIDREMNSNDRKDKKRVGRVMVKVGRLSEPLYSSAPNMLLSVF